ncbi:MAG: hypothetical protein Q7K26_02900 [bacterium]|nr:hypothetical protein [bacterium]
MNEEEKEILVENLYDLLPATINLKNLLGNEVFISWFLPRLKLIKEIQRWPQEKVDKLTQIRLKNFLTHLNNDSVFWSARFREYFLDIQSRDIFAELFKLPVINKATLIEWGDTALILHNNAPTIDYCTSGTTGVPLRGRIDEFDMIRNELLYVFEPDVFEIQRIGELLRRKFVLLIGRKSTGLWSPFSEYFPLDVYSAISNKKTRQEIYNKILDNSFICLSAYSSIALELMKYAREDGVALPLIAHISGEGISSEEERFIYDTTGVPITFQYNCKESGSVGEKCPINIGSSLYHIYRERVLVEIVDDDGKQLENDEEGNIVLTVLDRTAMPIIRYSSGDKGKILSKLCSCGRLSPLLELQGRQKDVILLPDDNTFNILLFRALFVKEIGLKNIVKYQIIQKKKDYLEINIVLRRNIGSEKIKLTETIMESVLHNKVKIDIKIIDHIGNYDSGKNKVFVSLEEYGKVSCV